MSGAEWSLFAVASAGGALVRWWTSLVVDRRWGGGWGTLVVNTTGSTALGALAGAVQHGRLGATALVIAGAGFCGSLTTFSTFALESLDLADRAGPAPAAAGALVSVLVPLAAAALGLAGSAALWA